MQIHPLCLVLPDMTASEYAKLVADIKLKRGLIHPIMLFEGMVLDGRHRLRACEESGIEPRFENFTGNDPAGYVASSCMHRSLNASQRAMIAAGFLEYERAEARKRKVALSGRPADEVVENFPQPPSDAGKARDKAGERMQVSGRTVDDAARVIADAVPEIVDQVRSGKMALNEAKTVIQLNPAAQKRVAGAANKADRKAVMQEAFVRREACKRRDAPKQQSVSAPSTPFVRKLLSGIERIAQICAEDGAKDAPAIAQRFMSEMDWHADALLIQLDRCEPVIRALALIKQQRLAA